MNAQEGLKKSDIRESESRRCIRPLFVFATTSHPPVVQNSFLPSSNHAIDIYLTPASSSRMVKGIARPVNFHKIDISPDAHRDSLTASEAPRLPTTDVKAKLRAVECVACESSAFTMLARPREALPADNMPIPVADIPSPSPTDYM